MKIIKLSYRVALFTAIILISGALYAQGTGSESCSKGKGKCKEGKILSDLTDEQTTQIEALKTKHLDIMLDFRARMNVLQAELRELEIADKADMNKINSKIDEITTVKNKMAKERSAHRQAVRNLLTPEQRVVFDSHYGHRRGHGHKAHINSKGKGTCTGKGSKKGGKD
jgi:Spy/CpxP family protein refolding chaperone